MHTAFVHGATALRRADDIVTTEIPTMARSLSPARLHVKIICIFITPKIFRIFIRTKIFQRIIYGEEYLHYKT